MSNLDLQRVVEYTLCNESVDYEEWVESGGKPEQHIYVSAKRLEDSVVALTKDECSNLLDALAEWLSAVGPKELDDGEEGLNEERYTAIVKKLRDAQEEQTS
jgi:uncharacterized protein YecA (UPF0149 family)